MNFLLVIFHFNPVAMLFGSLWGIVLAHLVPVVVVVAILLVIFVFGPVATMTFLRTRPGNILVGFIVGCLVAWYARATIDESNRLRDQLAVERADQETALDLERAKAKAASAAATEARRQAEDQRAIAATAAERETQARTEADALQEQVDDLNNHFAAAPTGEKHRFVLSADDAHRLRGVGIAAGPRKP